MHGRSWVVSRSQFRLMSRPYSPQLAPGGFDDMVFTLSFSDAVACPTGVLCLLGSLTLGPCGCASGPGTAKSSFLVQRLAPGVNINVRDNNLEEWPTETQVWAFDSSSAEQVTQVEDLRGRAPAEFSSGDARLRVLMAHDRQYWFLGFH